MDAAKVNFNAKNIGKPQRHLLLLKDVNPITDRE